MLNKFAIEYTPFPQHNETILTHRTDDPVEAEEFLMQLLVSRSRIREVRHEGTKMSDHQFDRMLTVAAERIVSLLLRESLGIDSAEAKHRFGFAA